MISRRTSKILSWSCDVKIIPKIDVSSEILGIRLYRDVETEVPNWVAEVLIREGLADPVPPEEDIGKLLFKEKTSITLSKVPCNLYQIIRKALIEGDELKERDAKELVNRRLHKILTYLRMSLMLEDRTPPKNILPEEMVLYKFLREAILAWLDSFVGERGGK